jgi:phosphatidylglycerophosphate synthase
MPNIDPAGRRPLKSRDLPVFKNLAAWLAEHDATPNSISFLSIIFGAGAGAALAATAHTSGWAQHACWLAAAAAIQLRLAANLLDGMVAVEGGKGGPTGELWNEAPDRVADALIFIGAGYAAGSQPVVGFAAALVAVLVAYVRALGASVGAGQIFLGPQAKPHRMAVMTATCVLLAIYPAGLVAMLPSGFFILLALAIVIAGGLLTAARRLKRIAEFLRRKQLEKAL